MLLYSEFELEASFIIRILNFSQKRVLLGKLAKNFEIVRVVHRKIFKRRLTT